MSKIISVALIAMVAHETNRAYCQAQGDDSQLAWADAPQWQKDSAQAGVEMHLANPDATPADSHASWLAHKLADGWKYGETKDAEKKEHPCCVAYDELPAEQKAKDYIFRGVVHAVNAIELPAAVAPAPVPVLAPLPVVVLGAGEIGVTYIGRRPEWTDRVYGSGIGFTAGQTRNLPQLLAKKLLRHGDLFEAAALAPSEPAPAAATDDTAALLAAAQKTKDEQQDEQGKLQDLYDQVSLMTKEALNQFANTNYRQTLNPRDSVATMREKVIGLIDQYGAV